MEVWQTSYLRRLRLGEENKEEQTTAWKYIWSALLHRATINKHLGCEVVKRCKYERVTDLGPSYCRPVQCSCSQSRRRRPARRTWSTCDPATCSTRTHGTCSPARLDNNNSLLLTLTRTQHQLSSPLHSIHYMVCSVHVQPIIVIATIILIFIRQLLLNLRPFLRFLNLIVTSATFFVWRGNLFLSPVVCLSVCLCVNRVTQRVMSAFSRNFGNVNRL